MSRIHSRRSVLGAFGVGLLGALAACAPPQPTFTPVPPTAAPKPTDVPKPAAGASTPATGGATTPAPATGGAATQPTAAAPAVAAPAVSKPAAGAAPVKLVFWTHNYQPLIAYTEKKIKEYKQELPNVDIEYSNTDVPSHERRIVTTLAAGAGFPDGFNSGEYWVAMHNEKKNIQTIPPEAFGKSSPAELNSLFYDYALPGLVVEGKMYAMPIEWNALSLYYNVKWFAKAGITKVPTDWNELTEAAVKLTERDSAGNIQKPGYQLTYNQTEWPLKRLNPMIVGLGGSLLNAEGTECFLNKPEAIEAIQQYTDWTAKHKVSMKGYQVPNLNNSQSLMAGGYYPMQTTGPYFAAALKSANANFKFGEDWNVAPPPQWPGAKAKKQTTALWRWALYLSAPSKSGLDMAKFFSFVLKDWKGVHTEVGFIPSLKGWENEAYTKEMPWLPQQMKDLQIAVPVPQTPRYPEIAQANLEMIERIESGQAKVQDAANEATKRINDALKTKP